MALYFLSYDLRNRRNYQDLYDKLDDFNAVRILESQWCFKQVNTSAPKLRDYFKQFVDSDDGLCVSEVTDWATYNVVGSPDDLE